MPTREELIEQLGYDPYGTSDGFWDGGKVHVKDAYFAYDEKYNADALLLYWECETDDEDMPETVLKFSCGGTEWRTEDDGKTATRDKMKPFTSNSHVGMVLKAAAELQIIDQLMDHGLPTEAEMWKDSNWELAPKEVNYGGEIGKKNKLIPTAFYGYSGNGSKAPVKGVAKKASATPAPAKAVAKKAVAKKVTAESGTDSRVLREAFKAQIGDDEVYNSLVEHAQNAGGDHGAFAQAVFEEYDPEGIEDMVLDSGEEGFFNVHKEPF